MKRVIPLLLLLALALIAFFSLAKDAVEGSLGDKTAKNCQNGGLPLCDWCKFKEEVSCPSFQGPPKHAEQDAAERGAQIAIGIGCAVILLFGVGFVLTRGRMRLA